MPSAGSWTLDIRHDLEVVPVDFQPIVVGGPAAGRGAQPARGPHQRPALLAVAAFLSMLLIATVALGIIAWRRTGPTPPESDPLQRVVNGPPGETGGPLFRTPAHAGSAVAVVAIQAAASYSRP